MGKPSKDFVSSDKRNKPSKQTTIQFPKAIPKKQDTTLQPTQSPSIGPITPWYQTNQPVAASVENKKDVPLPEPIVWFKKSSSVEVPPPKEVPSPKEILPPKEISPSATSSEDVALNETHPSKSECSSSTPLVPPSFVAWYEQEDRISGTSMHPPPSASAIVDHTLNQTFDEYGRRKINTREEYDEILYDASAYGQNVGNEDDTFYESVLEARSFYESEEDHDYENSGIPYYSMEGGHAKQERVRIISSYMQRKLDRERLIRETTLMDALVRKEALSTSDKLGAVHNSTDRLGTAALIRKEFYLSGNQKAEEFTTNRKMCIVQSDYYVNAEDNTPVMRLFGRSTCGRSVLCHVHDLRPYFFVKKHPDYDDYSDEELTRHLNTLVQYAQNQKKAPKGSVLSCCDVIMNDTDGYQLDPKSTFIRITLDNPRLVPSVRSFFEEGLVYSNVLHRTYESNIAFVLRSSLDMRLEGCSWIKIGGNEACHLDKDSDLMDSLCDIEVHASYTQIQPISIYEDVTSPAIRTLSFDIECDHPKGYFPDAKRDACIMISTFVSVVGNKLNCNEKVTKATGDKPQTTENLTNCDHKVIFTVGKTKSIDGVYSLNFDNETDMLLTFRDYIINTDPDILEGYNSSNFDIPYIFNRAEVLGIGEEFAFFSRIKDSPSNIKKSKFESRAFGSKIFFSCSISGRFEVDVMEYLRRTKKLHSYSLNSVASSLLKMTKDDINHDSVPDMFRGSDEERTTIARYCVKDSTLTRYIADVVNIMVTTCEISRITGISLHWVFSRGQQIRVQAKLLAAALKIEDDAHFSHRSAIWTPMKSELDSDGFRGAHVFSPKQGFYLCFVITLDYNSLYPSIIIHYNLCYTTYVSYERLEIIKKQLGDKFDAWFKECLYRTPIIPASDGLPTAGGHYFVTYQARTGLLGKVLVDLLMARKKVKAMMGDESDPVIKQVLSGREQGIKVTANSVYGFTGAQTMRLKAIAESVTSIGQMMIRMVELFVYIKYNKHGIPRDVIDYNVNYFIRNIISHEELLALKSQNIGLEDQPSIKRKQRSFKSFQEVAAKKGQTTIKSIARLDPSAYTADDVGMWMYGLLQSPYKTNDPHNTLVLDPQDKVDLNVIYGDTDSVMVAVTDEFSHKKIVEFSVDIELRVGTLFNKCHILDNDVDVNDAERVRMSRSRLYADYKSRMHNFPLYGRNLLPPSHCINPPGNGIIYLEFEKVYILYLLLAKKRYCGLKYLKCTKPVKDPKDPTKMTIPWLVFASQEKKGIESARRDYAPITTKSIDDCISNLFDINIGPGKYDNTDTWFSHYLAIESEVMREMERDKFRKMNKTLLEEKLTTPQEIQETIFAAHQYETKQIIQETRQEIYTLTHGLNPTKKKKKKKHPFPPRQPPPPPTLEQIQKEQKKQALSRENAKEKKKQLQRDLEYHQLSLSDTSADDFPISDIESSKVWSLEDEEADPLSLIQKTFNEKYSEQPAWIKKLDLYIYIKRIVHNIWNDVYPLRMFIITRSLSKMPQYYKKANRGIHVNFVISIVMQHISKYDKGPLKKQLAPYKGTQSSTITAAITAKTVDVDLSCSDDMVEAGRTLFKLVRDEAIRCEESEESKEFDNIADVYQHAVMYMLSNAAYKMFNRETALIFVRHVREAVEQAFSLAPSAGARIKFVCTGYRDEKKKEGPIGSSSESVINGINSLEKRYYIDDQMKTSLGRLFSNILGEKAFNNAFESTKAIITKKMRRDKLGALGCYQKTIGDIKGWVKNADLRCLACQSQFASRRAKGAKRPHATAPSSHHHALTISTQQDEITNEEEITNDEEITNEEEITKEITKERLFEIISKFETGTDQKTEIPNAVDNSKVTDTPDVMDTSDENNTEIQQVKSEKAKDPWSEVDTYLLKYYSGKPTDNNTLCGSCLWRSRALLGKHLKESKKISKQIQKMTETCKTCQGDLFGKVQCQNSDCGYGIYYDRFTKRNDLKELLNIISDW